MATKDILIMLLFNRLIALTILAVFLISFVQANSPINKPPQRFLLDPTIQTKALTQLFNTNAQLDRTVYIDDSNLNEFIDSGDTLIYRQESELPPAYQNPTAKTELKRLALDDMTLMHLFDLNTKPILTLSEVQIESLQQTTKTNATFTAYDLNADGVMNYGDVILTTNP